MRLPFVRSPTTALRPTPPPSPLARAEARLFHEHYARWPGGPAERRPLLWRHGTAPAAVQQRRHTDYFTLPFTPPPPPRHPVVRWLGAAATKMRAEAAEAREEAEAGCFRLAVRAATWWMWRRWRR